MNKEKSRTYIAGTFRRRDFLKLVAASSCAAFLSANLMGCASTKAPNTPDKILSKSQRKNQRLFFTSCGKTCIIDLNSGGVHPLELSAPNQVTWQPCGFLEDGRVLMLSMEARRDGPGRPFDEYYHQTPTHIWAYDLDSGELTELANKERLAPFYTPQLLLSNGRILVQIVRDKHAQIMNMNLDGTDAREFTEMNEGTPYGMSLSPDGNRVAFHLAGSRGYEVWTSDVFGGNRILVAGHKDHLYFGPSWSPDGQWLVYQDCQDKSDPGHDWSDICIGRPNGGEHRVLTEGQASWFCASYGPKDHHGGGSNTPSWTRDGKILFQRRTPDAKVAWEYQANRPDTDHFNRDFKPESAKGGTEVCTISPSDGVVTRLTHSEPPVWDFRMAESPDGEQIAFCRCATGESPSIWIMDRDGGNQRILTHGLDDKGADFPRWFPAPKKK